MSELQGLALREWAQLGKPLIGGDARKLEALLTALESDNADLNAELTETIAAVSDLMDENADLRLKLAEQYAPIIKLIDKRIVEGLMDRECVVDADTRKKDVYELGIAVNKSLKKAILELIPPKEATDERS